MILIIAAPHLPATELAELDEATKHDTMMHKASLEFLVPQDGGGSAIRKYRVTAAERANGRALSEVLWAPYREAWVASDIAERTHEPPAMPVRIKATSYQLDPEDIGEIIVIYWEPAS
jgi:hypothetical protein